MIKPPLVWYKGDKAIFLLRITCFFWFFIKVMSWRIWTTNRLLPTAPIADFFDYLPPILHTILFTISLCLLVAAFFKGSKPILVTLLAIEIISCILDQNRLQPWEYQYFFTVFLFIVNGGNRKIIPACFAFLLVSTYFYSGLSKINGGFLQSIWSTSILKVFFKIPAHIVAQNWVHYSGLLLGATELLGGIGLLFTKTQALSAKLLIVMHLFIIVFLGFFGYNVSKVLWVWNTSMIFYLYYIFIFYNVGGSIIQSTIQGINKLVFLCWGILPILSFMGYWDYYLSSNLFSGNTPKMVICIMDTSACKPLKRFCYKKDINNTCHGLEKTDIQTLAILETGVSAYPEIRVYKKMQQKLKKQYPTAGLNFVYFTR